MTSATPDGQSPVYLDELTPGRRFTTQRYELEEAELKAFAAQFDPQPFHLDAEAARHSVFGGLVASGWHTAAITMRLLITSGLPVAGGMIGLGGEISWPRPTRAGDVLYVESEVLAVKPSRRADRGVVTLRSQTCNQRGEVLQVFTARLLVPRRVANGGSQLSCDQR
jgi:acyl dehydratase